MNASADDPTRGRASPQAAEPSGPARPSLGRAVSTALGIAGLAWCWASLELDMGRLITGLPRMGDFLGRMAPPDLSVARTVAKSTGETIQIALLGTALAILASLPLSLLAASNLTSRPVHRFVKWALAAIRSVPLILLALFFVATVGLGALPGVLAIAVHSTGMLAKFFSEAMESASAGPMEALDSAGASWGQKIRYAVLPQVAPDMVRDAVFRFELNFRESLVLGLVGAGGIGFYIQLYVRAFQYEKVATLTLVVLGIVVVVEQLSTMIRERVR